MPAQTFFVDEAPATLDARDLGTPVRLRTNPRIGAVPVPAVASSRLRHVADSGRC